MHTYLWQCGNCGATGEAAEDKPHIHECPKAKQGRQERGARVRKKRVVGVPTMELSEAELQTLCEWFGAVQDTNPTYLERKDFHLGCRLYLAAGRRVTDEMRKKAGPIARSNPAALSAGSHFTEDNS